MNIPMAKYIPTSTDLQWAREMMRILAEGGMMTFPETQVTYEVSHKNKTLTLLNPEQLLSFPSFEIHYQTIDVFHEIGYTVFPSKEEETQAA